MLDWDGYRKAIVARIGTGLQTVDQGGDPATFEQLFLRLISGPVLERELAIAPSTAIPNVDADVLDWADTVFVFASIAPASRTNPAPAVSVQPPAGRGITG